VPCGADMAGGGTGGGWLAACCAPYIQARCRCPAPQPLALLTSLTRCPAQVELERKRAESNVEVEVRERLEGEVQARITKLVAEERAKVGGCWLLGRCFLSKVEVAGCSVGS